jgi:2'-5' RNA ligase
VALIGLKVPHETGRLLTSVDVPGERHSPSDMHVTILFPGKGWTELDAAKAMMVAYQVAQRFHPFIVYADRVASFPSNPNDGVPIICPLISPHLHALKAALESRFDAAGIEYSKKWPEYKPHVTMAYLKDAGPGITYEEKLPGLCAWVASELMIWAGDDMDDKMIITIPFVLQSPNLQKIARSIASGR